MIALALAVVCLLALTVHLGRLVMRDGHGSTPPPRSHAAELGTWVDQELGR